MNLYSIFGLTKHSFSQKKLKSRFRKLAKENHPDVGGDPAEFGRVKMAYDVLMDLNRKTLYDLTGEVDPKRQDNIENKALNFIFISIDKAKRDDFLGNGLGIIETITKMMNETQVKLKTAMAEKRRERVKLEKMRRSIIAKKKDNDIFKGYYEREEYGIKQALQNLEFEGKALDRSLEILRDYEDDESQVDRVPRYYSFIKEAGDLL